MRKEIEKPVDPRFALARGERWFHGARVRKQAPVVPKRKRR